MGTLLNGDEGKNMLAQSFITGEYWPMHTQPSKRWSTLNAKHCSTAIAQLQTSNIKNSYIVSERFLPSMDFSSVLLVITGFVAPWPVLPPPV